jgi:hypothetical protein
MSVILELIDYIYNTFYKKTVYFTNEIEKVSFISLFVCLDPALEKKELFDNLLTDLLQ